MKNIALIFELAFALTTGMAVVTVVAHTDQAMAYTTIITNGDQASGGCGGAGC
jgi:hypothetical protein